MTEQQQIRGPIQLPIRGEPPARLRDGELTRLAGLGSATACAKLHQEGIRRSFVDGPTTLTEGARVSGTALTLQFMPQREDIGSGAGQEYVEKHTALWAVLEEVRPGDVLVVQAYQSAYTGCLGDMLVRYFQRKGGAGIIVDGRVRDAPRLRSLGVPIWCTGTTPHYASQTDLFPWAYHVPIAVGGVLCLPGDGVIADDDGAVVIPRQYVDRITESSTDHDRWEEFSRWRIDNGGRLADYYPLTPESRSEYEVWRDLKEHERLSGR